MNDVLRGLRRPERVILAVVMAIMASFGFGACGRAATPEQTITSLGDADKAAILRAHNDVRQQSNVPELAWDDNLAGYAQQWADRLAGSGRFQHRIPNQYGENLWTGTAGAFAPASGVISWASEARDYDANTNTCASGKVCGHFTQIVWSSTARVGCGLATGSGMDVLVCNYDPPGNYAGLTPFGTRRSSTSGRVAAWRAL